MGKTEKAFDNELHREFKKATQTEIRETKMKETITVNKFKYNSMKFALYAFVALSVIAVSIAYGRNWGYTDHQSEVNKITAAQQLKTKQ